MAVTLTITDLQQPTGELDSDMFPLGNIDILLSGWLAQAETKVTDFSIATQNDAAAAWVYYRGFSAIAQRLAATPSSKSVDSGAVTVSTSADQRKYFDTLAKYWFDIFNALDVVTPSLANPAFFGSVKARRYGSTYCG